jgi:sterol desaturase/sphingolipid hydroxylase (fatty acid hydroxylase superfamily)
VVTVLIASAIGIEAFVTWRAGSPTYTLREAELSLALAAGSLALSFYLPSLTFWLPRLLHFTPVAVPSGLPGLVLLIVAGDFTLYWSHRGSHAFRWQWAAHEAHHTSTRLNFLASLRQGWTDLPAGIWVYTLPLAAFGFTTAQWTSYFLVNFCWQMFAHNEWCPKLGLLEAVLVTPSHHRVHHDIARNREPKNLANIFIVWDRLFGTFEAERPVRVAAFGVADRRFSGVWDAAFGEWRTMLFETRGPAKAP